MSDSIIIATRESPLALWQAEHVQALLRERYPEKDVKLLGMTTKGDQILDKTLSKIGGKGLFVKELEVAMQEGSAHLAVHSLKDVPMELPEGFVLAAVSSREDPRDAFVSPRYETLESMPAGSVVGTASLRRELMLRSKFPHLVVKPVRGNVGTRLRKLDSGEYDALIMASAGLKRLGLEERIREIISDEISLPSPGQGALGLECLADDEKTREAVAFINDEQTRACCLAERAVSRALGGSCQVPLAAYATITDSTMRLRALIGDHTTGELVATEQTGPWTEYERLASEAVEALLKQGARRYIEKLLTNQH
ncbi:hydroxymethylbilane synthase [Parasutterella secunda]|uniref:hydroxymethylbilane synthase n=1 Tax=Parasutterella secunda TaxID=626947 RepID=UPI001F84D3CD|nr:hydroxymethylbilane synthase [Parasutterella secunda]MCL1596737.1 hydroxymethylbilane synthase [Parasutterella secunda]MDM8227387.1 hydroxymethylbilane synthase [Parasutterella secunda]HIR21649.1 hydroxymethylbilane synthase [Candidatus Aphodousia faecalis]